MVAKPGTIVSLLSPQRSYPISQRKCKRSTQSIIHLANEFKSSKQLILTTMKKRIEIFAPHFAHRLANRFGTYFTNPYHHATLFLSFLYTIARLKNEDFDILS